MADGSDQVVGEEFDVFISYAHADREEDSDRSPAQTLAGMLEAEGYRVWWDRELIGGEDWLRELPTNIGLSRKVVALVSPRWLASMDCYAEMVRAYETPGKLVPVLIDDCALPRAIAHLHAVKAIGSLLLAKALILAAIELEPKQRAKASSTPTDPNRVQLALPSGADRLFGRDRELTTLANAWATTSPGKKTIVVFHAIGGAGKSALVRAFIDELAQRGYPGAQKVYGWSAYNQNSGENDDTTNAEGFVANALKFFGHDLADEPITDGAERGRTLARLVRAQRSLFILDGLEPLQDALLVNGGRLKDRSLATFITMLADDNPGLLVITSRQELPELANRPLVLSHALDQLDTRAGAELLKNLGVHGRERELMDAVTEAGGHAPSVNLLGTYLANVCAGDVTRRDTLKLGDIIEDMTEQDETARKAKRAQRVMEAYDERFHELAASALNVNGVAELMIMRLVGLFNRPAEPAAIAAVLSAPPIPGLTDAWHSLTPLKRQHQWGFAMARLRKLKLLLGSNAVADALVDAHPVVRQHFGAELARAAPSAFREANDRLYRYYVALPEKEQPETLAEMEPLFHAITHGCAAGRHPEVWSNVYQKRLNREGGTFFIIKQLGAIGASLGALANFFTPPWRTPHSSLRLVHQASAFGHAAAALHALGRLRDAIEPMEAGARLRIARKDWEGAAREYSNLSEL